MMRCIRRGLHSSLVPRPSVLKSRLLHVFDLSGSRLLDSEAIRDAGTTMKQQKTRYHPMTVRREAHAESARNASPQVIDLLR